MKKQMIAMCILSKEDLKRITELAGMCLVQYLIEEEDVKVMNRIMNDPRIEESYIIDTVLPMLNRVQSLIINRQEGLKNEIGQEGVVEATHQHFIDNYDLQLRNLGEIKKILIEEIQCEEENY